jgi:RHS repeat-associated protein
MICNNRQIFLNLTACNYSYIQLIDFNARFYSPTLGRFIQPDSIIPVVTNAQSWNRYSYVQNNPVKYIDPSGHIPELECGFSYGGCSTSSDEGTPEQVISSQGELENDLEMNPPSGQNNGDCIVCLPTDPTLPDDLPPYPSVFPPVINQPQAPASSGWDDPFFEEYLKIFAKNLVLPLLDFMNAHNEIINLGKPYYRQVKYSFPTGPLEATIDGLLQAQTDSWSDSLTTRQRIWRPVIVAGETLAIDRLSGAAGKAVGLSFLPLGPISIPISLASQYLVSSMAQEFVKDINPTLFNRTNLGVYP